jgi:RimJ/RimL family protein N-acetyltransferase
VHANNVVLDRLVPQDAAASALSHSDPENVRYQGWDSPLSRDEARTFITSAVDEPLIAGSAAQLAIRHAVGAPLAGDLYLARPQDRQREVELGITLVPGFGGRGLAAEAVRLAVDTAFAAAPGPVAVHRVVAVVDVDNLRSRRLFEQLGFRLEGRLVLSGQRRDGSFADELVLAVVRGEWWNGDTGEPVAGGWPAIEVDTRGQLDVAQLARQVRSRAGRGR